jgi:hypothetical protein
MKGIKATRLFRALKEKHIVGAKGVISVELLDLKVQIKEKSAIGNIIQEWLASWMQKNEVYFSEPTNTQEPPDFFLGKDKTKDWLEVKTFDYSASPNFDVANFDAYVRDLRTRAFRLDADYLIFGYTLDDGVLKINDVWLKKVWEITCGSDQFAIRAQVKQNKIVNIRPYNFKDCPNGFPPFSNRLAFVEAMRETLKKYRNENEASDWYQEVRQSYESGRPIKL